MTLEDILLGGAGGGAGTLVLIKIYQMIMAAKAGADHQQLGSRYDQHMYGRMRDLEDRERLLNMQLLTQATEMGELKAKVKSLEAELEDAKSDYEEAKGLLAKLNTAYEKVVAENTDMRKKLRVNPTGKEGRPFLPGGGV